MATRTPLATEVAQGVTSTLDATFKNEAGATITGGLTTLTMTLRDVSTGRIINGRDQTDVNSSETSGVLALAMTVEDNAMINANLSSERHIALFEFTFGSGKVGKHEVTILVNNIGTVGS